MAGPPLTAHVVSMSYALDLRKRLTSHTKHSGVLCGLLRSSGGTAAYFSFYFNRRLFPRVFGQEGLSEPRLTVMAPTEGAPLTLQTIRFTITVAISAAIATATAKFLSSRGAPGKVTETW